MIDKYFEVLKLQPFISQSQLVHERSALPIHGYKIIGPNSVTYFNRTHIIEWSAWLGVDLRLNIRTTRA